MRILRYTLAIIMLPSFIFSQPAFLFAEEPRIGTTYSKVQCEYFGQNWKEVYISILDMGIDIIRLGAYWSRIEEKKGRYDFKYLDWQISEAKKRNIPVILTVGMKAPRWPEYFIPERILEKIQLKSGQDVSKSDYLRKETIEFVKKVVNRYRDESIICCWQVENEPFDKSGPDRFWIGPAFLKEEVGLVRSLDPEKRPIMINVATYPNKILHFLNEITRPTDAASEATKLADILGLNIYPVVGHKMQALKFYFRTSPEERIKYFAPIIQNAKKEGKDVWVTELQAEPWEPGQVVHEGEEDPLTVSPSLMAEYLDEVLSLGIDTVLLWGAEYWLYRKERYGDTGWLDKVNAFKHTPIYE
ncbi:MAG: beta-galactosidase [Candidatus Omnitrophica bacterium]|nr:beta-galactosidase [Candidatus Omnitrophota bacterium]